MAPLDQEIRRRDRLCRRPDDGCVVSRWNDQLGSGKPLEQPADDTEFADVGQVFSHDRRIAASLRTWMLALEALWRP